MKQDLTQNDGLQHAPTVFAAIPCFNEERFIGSVVVKAKKYADRVMVIDDGSTDGSAEVAAESGAVVYQHGRNLGYGAAIRSALEKGKQLGADILVILDGDGQHDPRDIPRLVKPIVDRKADIVIGSRFIGEGKATPFYRRVGQRLLTAVTNLGSGQKISDSQSGFRAYSARALRDLNLTESGMSVSSEIQFAISRSALRVSEVPINVTYVDKTKRNPVGHGVGVLSRVFVLFSLRQPLLLFGLPGFGLLAGGVALGGRVLVGYSETHVLAVGYALGTILLSLTGLLALFTGLMLQAIKELMRRENAQFLRELQGYSTSAREK